MPTLWNQSILSNRYNEQDRNQFARYQVWLAAQTTRKLQYYSRWKNMFPKIKWTPNMGDLMQGIVPEPSPVTAQEFHPSVLSAVPGKTIVSHFERTNNARVKRHLFESLQFNFLPSFQDFRKKQISFASTDLDRQIAIAYDMFVRSYAFQMSPYIWAVNNGTGNANATGFFGNQNYIKAPVGDPTAAVQAKSAAVRAAWAANLGPNSFLDFRQMCALRDFAKTYVNMPGWDGSGGSTPKDCEVARGKYILMGESQIYSALSFDSHVLNFKDLNRDVLNKEFSGCIADNIAFREERYPLLMAADGTFPVPEIELDVTGNSGAASIGAGPQREVIPNPAYVAAPYGWAFFIGYDPYESLEIGPPPEEFASGKVDMRRFSQLKWNGEVRLTDNLLINYGIDPNTNQQVIDTNKYGERLQLIADGTFGIIGNTTRFLIPVLYSRRVLPSLYNDPLIG